MQEVEKLHAFTEAFLPFTAFNIRNFLESCVEDLGRITSLSVFKRFEIEDKDLLVYFELRRAYEGSHFWDSEDLSMDLRFLDPSINLERHHERILAGRLPGAVVFDTRNRTRNGKQFKIKKQKANKEKKGQAQEKPGKAESPADSKEKEIQDLKEQLDLEKAKVQKAKFKGGGSVVSSDILDEAPRKGLAASEKGSLANQSNAGAAAKGGGLKRSANLSGKKNKNLNDLAKVSFKDEFTIDLRRFILEGDLRKYLLNLYMLTTHYSKIREPQDISFLSTEATELFVYAESKARPGFWEFVPFDEKEHKSMSLFEVVGQRILRFDEPGTFDRPAGYKMNFNYVWDELSEAEDEFGTCFRLHFYMETPQDSKDELGSAKELLWPLPLEEVEQVTDSLLHDLRGMTFESLVDSEQFRLAYFLVFSNNSISPNNNTYTRASLTSMFEGWLLVSQRPEHRWIPTENRSRSLGEEGLSSVLSVEALIRNFLQEALYCGHVSAQGPGLNQVETALIDVVEFQLRRPGGKWGAFGDVEVERPESAFQMLRHSFVFRLRVSAEMVEEWLGTVGGAKAAAFELSPEAEQRLREFDATMEKVVCIASLEFEIRDQSEAVLKGMPEEDYFRYVEKHEDLGKFTLVKLNCKNVGKGLKGPSPRWLVNEIDIVYDLMRSSKKPSLRNDTYHALV